MDYALSNVDINKLVKEVDKKGANIENTDDIKKNTPIEKIFKNRGHTILFHDWKEGDEIGHWVAMLRNPKNEVMLFDSLATPINELNPDLKQFFKNNGIKELIINRKQYQNEDNSTCGRYAVLIVALSKLGLDFRQIIDFMDKLKGSDGTFDEGVLNITEAK